MSKIEAHISPRNALTELRKIKNRTRQQVVRSVLSLTMKLPDATLAQLRQQFPDMDEEMSVEEAITIMLVGKVMRTGDVNAYNALMDSAYGKPNQQLNIKDESISNLKLPKFLEAQVVEDVKPL